MRPMNPFGNRLLVAMALILQAALMTAGWAAPATISVRGGGLACGTLREGALTNTNRTYTFTNIPKELGGLQYVLPPHKDRQAAVSVTATAAGDLFICLGADRPGDAPTQPTLESLKLAGRWEPAGAMTTIISKKNYNWNIYRTRLAAGQQLTLPAGNRWGIPVLAGKVTGVDAAKAVDTASQPQAPRIDASDEFALLGAQIAASKNWNLARLEKEALRRDALILPADRTPVDVAWRRTCALLDCLRQMDGAPDLSGETAGIEELKPEVEKLRARPDAPESDLRTLFGRITKLRRQIAFKNPLLDFNQILFVKRHRSLFEHMCDQFYGIAQQPGGGLYVLSDPFGPAPQVKDILSSSKVEQGRLKGQTLRGGTGGEGMKYDGVGHLKDPRTLHDGGSFLSPELSYDGKQVVFAYVECTGDPNHRFPEADPDGKGQWDPGRAYHIFKANLDGSGLAQLTDGPWNDFDPCWMPDGRIAFVSERCGGYLRCGRVCPVYTIYDMDSAGGGITKLSYHETHEWQPSVGNDGMLLYTRWDYVDRDSDVAHSIWISYPDGRDPRTAHGNYPEQRELRPWMEMSIRAVPGMASKYVATASTHHGQTWGSLVVADLTRPDDGAMGQLRRLTPEVPLPESESAPGVAHPKGKHNPLSEAYGTAWPLSEDFHLAVYSPEVALSGSTGAEKPAAPYAHGIYLVDSFGNKELIYRDPSISCMDPIPVRPRTKPPVIPALRVAEAETAKPEKAAPHGEIAIMNVYDSARPWPDGTKITALRIINIFPKTTPEADIPRIGHAAQSMTRGVLGTVPVESDGSAYFTVPSGAPLYFQALDEHGLAVQTMRSDTYVHPGERLTCAGCHEGKHRASPGAERPTPLALRRAPSQITPGPEGSYPLTFPRLVQPVLEQNCIGCHAKQKKAPSLAGNRFGKYGWSESFHTLQQFAWGMSGGNGTALRERQYSVPGQDGARVSKLFAMLSAGHHKVNLDPAAMARITLWLDCNSNFYGDYFEIERQARGEIITPTLGLPESVDFAKIVR